MIDTGSADFMIHSRSNTNYVTPIGTAAVFRLTYISSAAGGKQLRFLHDKRKG